jgi:dipeptidyl aminopeptidase/acylaminoacyl peptidase
MRLFAFASLALMSLAATSDQHPITFDDFAAVGAVSDPQISPDGKTVLFAVSTVDLAANKRTSATWRVASSGGSAHRFPDDSTHAAEARWSPDGRRVAYIAGDQLWVASAEGTAPHKITSLSGDATGPKWSPDGQRIAFTSRVYPACSDDACNAKTAKLAESNPVKAHIADHLLYRHWNVWDDGTRAHLFVVSPDGGTPADLTPGAPYDVPPGPFGGSEGYAFSPDGKELAFSAKDQGASDAWSTNVDVYTVPVSGGAATDITRDNHGADDDPVYSPDGRYIAYQSQARPGFESDRWRLMLYDRQSSHAAELLPSWDRNADAYCFAPDSALIIGTVDKSRTKIYRAPLSGGTPTLLIADHNNSAFTLSADGRMMTWVRDAADHPAEVYSALLGPRGVAQVKQISHVNDALVSHLKLNPLEEFWFAGAGGDSVQGFVMKPPQWEANKTYPAVVLIHGGPQGEWLDNWHSRWNYQMFAAPGFGIIVINPRGSNGYGQKFVDEVSKDWGGKAYTDIMDGVDAALAHAPWIDRSRLGAAGGSYGGYMVNWIAGHTDRFKALVSHAGPYNLENMYGATEEVWFPEWEFAGPYWDSTAMATQYRVYSPHLYAKNFKTPTLVLHGERDYRVPYTEGLSMFTALQRQGVPSRLVVFPDEGHWIGKPQNQKLWWSEVQGWLEKYLIAPPRTAAGS